MKKDFKTLRILVVDDEPLILHCVARFLKKRALVKTASTAEEALNEIEDQHYDLCFLDVIMPGKMTGLEAMKIINERSPNTKVAIMTATPLNEAMKEQVEDYACALIEKPFNLSDVGAVAEMVEVALN
jgi:DNA-binding NtrC family response regulator